MFPQVLEEALDLPAPAGWAELSQCWSTDTETNETRTTNPTVLLRVPGVSLLLSLCASLQVSLPL